MKNKGYAKFVGGGGGAHKAHYGRCASGKLIQAFNWSKNNFGEIQGETGRLGVVPLFPRINLGFSETARLPLP